MLTSQRKALLLSRLAKDGRLVVTDLSVELGLSEDTVRRDLRDLAADGLLVRVHGGALPASPTHLPFQTRLAVEPMAKVRLGRAGAGLIRPGQIVIVDGGTTHLALVAALPVDLRCTIITHSPAIAAALERCAGIEIILIGGRIFRHSMVASGPIAQEAFGRLRADLCLLGVTGLHADTGATTGDAEEAALKATMTRAAAETVVLATDDKLGVTSAWQIMPLSGLATVVTCGARPDWLPTRTGHVAA